MSRLPRERYLEQRSFDQYDPIDFFDFCNFSSDEKVEAGFQWKTFILPHVLLEDPAQHRRLVVSWDESRRTRQLYWDVKRLDEERASQLVSISIVDKIKETAIFVITIKGKG